MGYRDDDFRREQDRRYENFRDDVAWKQKVRDRDSSLAEGSPAARANGVGASTT